jgi:hypothetical protein
MGECTVSTATASVLANRRHRAALIVARGIEARVQDRAVDMAEVGRRGCRDVESPEIYIAYVRQILAPLRISARISSKPRIIVAYDNS